MRHSPMTFTTLAALATGLFTFAAPASGQPINEDLKLLASDGAPRDWFGDAIAIDNGIVAVGAEGDGDNGDFSGSAYLFDASTGDQLFKLLASDGGAFQEFGFSIAIDNGIVAVGAYQDDDNGTSSGSAYLFDASTGAQLFKLLPSDGAAGAFFGYSIAIDNGVVAVGAEWDDDNGFRSGSAYLFDASTGAQLYKLLPSDGAEDDLFGYSIAIDNGVVAVGARSDGDNGDQSGSAYLFDASTGVQLFKLLPSDGVTLDYFGWSIAIDNGVVAVGAARDDDNGIDSGSAYLFDASTGVQLFKLLPNDGAPQDYFGYSIAIDNGVVAVGAYADDDNGSISGSAYLFDASNGAQLFKLLPSDGHADDNFGRSIAIVNGVVAVGAYRDDDNGFQSGSAYVFGVPVPTGIHLSADGTCPGGGPIQISWTDATPGGRVALIFARNLGNFIVPARYPCQGTQLGLGTDLIQLVGTYGAGEDGERTINGFAGNGTCGGHLQLLDLTTCATSNVVTIE